MWTIHKSASASNPFHEIVGELSKETWIPVTIAYLTKVANLLNTNGKIVDTYGETFTVLEFLRDSGAVELELLNGTTNMYKIKKGY